MSERATLLGDANRAMQDDQGARDGVEDLVVTHANWSRGGDIPPP